MASDQKSGELFTRRASGLTRSVSPWSALAFAFVGPGMTSSFLYYVQAQSTYPGSNGFWMSFLILTLFPVAGIYVFMSLSMPRSGGEYIYVSRILHPLLGFIACWTLTIVGINWSGLLTQWTINWGIGQTLLTQGILWKNQTMIDWGKFLSYTNSDSQWVVWIMGTIILAVTFYIMSRGTKAVMKVFWVTFWCMWVMLIAFVIVALTAGPDRTIAGMEALQGIKFSDLTAKVNEISGGAGLPVIAFLPTVYAGLVWPNLNVLGATYAANLSGEIKKVNVAMPLAQMGAMIMFFVWWLVFTAVANAGIGENLIRTIGYLETQGAASAIFGTYPLISYMVMWATDNWLLVALAGPFLFMIATWGGGVMALPFAPTRNLFAFSFDGILPAWVNKVARNGSPNNAVYLAGAIAWCIFTVATFTTWLSYITYTVTIWMVGWAILSVAAMVFPWKRRDIFEKSPQLVQSRILGMPVITILGVLGFIVSVVTLYATLLVGDTPTINPQILAYTASFFIILPIIIYVIAYYYRRSQGVPMDLRFKTIPPD
jgi:amino acid transporter